MVKLKKIKNMLCSGTCSCKDNPLNADGLFGTGICLSKDCKDRMNAAAQADAALKAAQANALNQLSSQQQSSGSNKGVIIAVVVIVAIMIIGGVVILVRRGKKGV